MRSRSLLIGLASGLIVLMAVLVLVGLRSSSRTTDWQATNSQANGQGRINVEATDPCGIEGHKTDLATAAVGFTLLMPNDGLASQDQATVWDCPGPYVSLAFPSGVQISEGPNDLSDPAAAWKRVADDDPDSTTVGTIMGDPASFVDPMKDKSHTARGGVMFVHNGVSLIVAGDGSIPLTDLQRVTESLQPVRVGAAG